MIKEIKIDQTPKGLYELALDIQIWLRDHPYVSTRVEKDFEAKFANPLHQQVWNEQDKFVAAHVQKWTQQATAYPVKERPWVKAIEK